MLFAQDCIRFKEKTEIGFDPKTGIKKYISFEVRPCQSNCPAKMGDPDYVEELQEFLTHFVSIIRILDSTSNFTDYSKPFKQEIGSMMETMHHAKHISKKTFNFGQIVLSTVDGLIFKKSVENVALDFKDSAHRYRPRLESTDPFTEVTLELSGSV